MTTRRDLLTYGAGFAAFALIGCEGRAAPAAGNFPYKLTDAQWRAKLGPAYAVLRQAATERAGSSPLDREKRAGTFVCKGCGQRLYSSRTKFDSGTGWPSFWQALPKAVGTSSDTTLGMTRTEVHCSNCGGHLGHIFDDGPPPTGKRHCINGIALNFAPGRA